MDANVLQNIEGPLIRRLGHPIGDPNPGHPQQPPSSLCDRPHYRERCPRRTAKLIGVLKDEGPAFIYLDKFGVHSPYATKYPSDFRVFPTPTGFELADREVMLAHYWNAIVWSVDEFFRKLLPPAPTQSPSPAAPSASESKSIPNGGSSQDSLSGRSRSLGEPDIQGISAYPQSRLPGRYCPLRWPEGSLAPPPESA